MLADFIKKFTQPTPDNTQPQVGEKDVAVATAALFMEVAWADHEFSDNERHAMRTLMRQQLNLTLEEIERLLTESLVQHQSSVGMQRFTRALTDAWEEPQRFDLMVALWQLAMADESVGKSVHRYEEHALRRIADLLYLSHTRFIEAKLSAKRA